MFKKTEKQIMSTWKGDHSTPLVSIICVTYNQEQYIADAICSFLSQETDFPFEVLVGEDCSIDETAEIVADFASKYPNIIRVITGPKNVGPMMNGYRLLKAVRSEFVATCDGDDYWTDNQKLQMQVDFLRDHPSCKLCTHAYTHIDSTGKKEIRRQFEADTWIDANAVIRDCLGILITSAQMFRYEAFSEVADIFMDSPQGDVLLGLSAAVPEGIFYFDKCMSAYRSNVDECWTNKTFADLDSKLDWLSEYSKCLDTLNARWQHGYNDVVSDAKEKACNYILMQLLQAQWDSVNSNPGRLNELADALNNEGHRTSEILNHFLIALHHFAAGLPRNQKYVLYGSGTVGRMILPYIKSNTVAIVDKVVSTKQQKMIEKTPVRKIDDLSQFSDVSIVVSPLYQHKIIQKTIEAFDHPAHFIPFNLKNVFGGHIFIQEA
jgi:glycosyltransferase involved in cell wall biosynthesis